MGLSGCTKVDRWDTGGFFLCEVEFLPDCIIHSVLFEPHPTHTPPTPLLSVPARRKEEMSDPVNGQHVGEELEEEFVVNDHEDVGEDGEEDDEYEVDDDEEVCFVLYIFLFLLSSLPLHSPLPLGVVATLALLGILYMYGGP